MAGAQLGTLVLHGAVGGLVSQPVGAVVGWLAERERTAQVQAVCGAAEHAAREARRAEEARAAAFAAQFACVAGTLPRLAPEAQVAAARVLADALREPRRRLAGLAGAAGLLPGD